MSKRIHQKHAKKPHRLARTATLSAVLLLCTVWIAADSLFDLRRASETAAVTVTVPDLRGRTFSDADGALVDPEHFELAVTYVYDPETPPRTVLSQEPLPGVGRKLVPGETLCRVSVVVSLGEHRLRMPDVTGRDAREACVSLRRLGFAVTEISRMDTVSHETLPSGTVLETVPAAGETVPEGAAVRVYVATAKPRPSVRCPDLTGLTRAEAEARLRAAGLTVGTVTEMEPEDVWGIRRGYRNGAVLSQDRLPDTYLLPDAAVSFTVAKGCSAPYWFSRRPILWSKPPSTK